MVQEGSGGLGELVGRCRNVQLWDPLPRPCHYSNISITLLRGELSTLTALTLCYSYCGEAVDNGLLEGVRLT